jgi:N-methylhydantoinase A
MAGYDHIITLDIGGTSTDVALCPGVPTRRAESEIDGLPLRTRMIDIETVGAGGGSIARLDSGGALRVGPESAGANPGPVVYGRGGEQITVSDANAVLGRLDSHHFLGGTMPLQMESAQASLERLGASMDMSAIEAALGVIRLANANIERAVRRVSIARGHDPRHFTLVAFGGAGPLHACEVAERLQIPHVFVPRYPGVLCALGLLVADVQIDFSRSILNISDEDIASLMSDLRQQAQAALAGEGISETEVLFTATIDARYQGQAYELSIPFSTDPFTTQENFHAAHQRAYGHAFPDRVVEKVTVRVQAIATTEKPTFLPMPKIENDASSALIGFKDSFATGRTERPALYERDQLTPGACFEGPALVFQLDCTTFVPRGWQAEIDEFFNINVRNSY